MMATEATVAKPVESHVPSDSQLAPNTESESTSHNEDPGLRTVNGGPTIEDIENKHITGIEERVHSVDGSVSGGSDTDASRTKDGQGHSRTSSVKKPTTFKAVSVNKTFLGAKGVSGPSMSKSSEKSSTTTGLVAPQTTASSLSASRPRLIAKTASGSRDTTPRFAVNGGRPAAAPDPSAVWNKNRPTPTPEPKKLTDEELKKYGIHMATRLQSDDLHHGQSNWADIDDDDDDWAPETVTWADGTKVTLPHPDEAPNQVADPTPAAAAAAVTASAKEKPTVEKPRSPAPSSTAPSSVKPSGLPSGKGLILKSGSTEKVTLVAKPPAPPAPTKSPWAPLPPIEKASPVAVDASQQHPGSRHGNRDSMPPARMANQGQSQGGHSQPVTREIAPDDFSRSSWRDSPNMANRELYNSHSGRYEPVGDRRGSFRTEGHGRPPAVLQRPHHGDRDRERDRDHVAEPSPHFQTSRGGPDVYHVRRRGSSNVSGGSGYMQRMGKGYEPGAMPPPEVLSARRGSFTGSTDSPVSPRNFSPSGQHGGRLQSGHGWAAPRASPSMMQATPHQGGGGAPPDARPGPSGPNIPSEDQTVEYQKRLMREKREEAIRRRLEEDAREEAAKQERIRQKLAAMGPAPERRSARKEAASKDETGATPPTSHAEPSEAAQTDRTESTETMALKLDSASVGHPAAASKGDMTDGSTVGTQSGQSKASDLKQSNPWDGSVQAPPDRFTTWPSAAQQGTRNVWGSPNNDRGLGNGTFNPDLGRVPESQATPAVVAQTPSKGPAPIAPPTQSRIMARSQSGQQAQSAQQSTQPSQPYSRSRGDSYGAGSQRPYNETQSRWVSAVLQSDNAIREQQLKERADLDRRLAEQGLTYEQAQPAIKHTWRQERTVALEPRPKGSRREPPTAKQPASPEGSGSGSGSSAGLSINRPNGVTAGTGIDSPSLLPPSGSAASSQARPSRFFPPKDARQDGQSQAEYDRSPSPPPPTMADHPAYDGDVAHPHVSLPRPQPIVKLPPAIAAAPPSTTATSAPPSGPSSSWASRKTDSTFAWANPPPYRGSHPNETTNLDHPSPGGQSGHAGRSHAQAGHQGHQGHHGHPTLPMNTVHSQAEWQEKIYELTGRRSGPPKSPAVESASKSALDQPPRPDSATVSLPSSLSGYLPVPNPYPTRDSQGATSKPMAEECFEEQEMGSLPPVRIPHKAPEAGWQPAMPPKPLPKRFTVEACSVEIFVDTATGHSGMRVCLPFLEPKVLTWGRGSTRGSHRGFGQGDYGNLGRGSPRPRGRSGYRGRAGGDWSRRGG